MANISLISWRRREKTFPETEAQRRARPHERGIDSDRCDGRMEGLDVLTAAPPVELFEFDEGHVMDELDALALLNSTSFPHTVEETYNTSAKVRVSMCLTAVRSCVLHALPLLSALAGNFAETQQYFLTVVSLNDSSAYAHFCLALLHECMDLFDEVIVAYHTALNRNPYYLKALFNMAKF